jgi:alkanesulfonate monooxygenase SsuD/methylene tetrahydromethanopterin reductase-like flavin-dependent oxidoreductase (luciferase family)
VTTGLPLARGSISLRIYPHPELAAVEIVDELRAQARRAADAGFDGVMTSEHHGGFAGYLPNPVQAAGWLLESMPTGWAAPCPLLLPLRPTALVAEELAWLAVRFPDRVGLGVAAGSRVEDFEVMEQTKDGLTARFAGQLDELVGLLDGTRPGALGDDQAIRRCAEHPVPIVSAAMSRRAAARAARLGCGILLDSLSSAARARELTDAHREAGGNGARVLIRRAWVGRPPTAEVESQVDLYRGYAEAGAQQHWTGEQLVAGDDPDEVAERLAQAMEDAGADALNLRVHAVGIAPAAVRDQIDALGPVVDRVRQTITREPAG